MIFRAALGFGILYFVSLKGWVKKMYSEHYSEISLYWLNNYYFYSVQGLVTTKITQINVSLKPQPEA